MRAEILARLETIIRDGARSDSTLFELIKNYKKVDLPHKFTDTFQDRKRLENNFNDQLQRAKLHKNES